MQIETDKKELERQLKEIKANTELAEKKMLEQRLVDEKRHAEEINFLKKTNQQMKVRQCSSISSHLSIVLSSRLNSMD